MVGTAVRRLALFVVRRRWWVVAAVVVFVLLAAVYGRGVHDELSSGGFSDPASESARAGSTIARDFPSASQTDFVILVTATHGYVDDPAVRAAGLALTAQLGRARGVLGSSSYWSLANTAPLRSRNRRQALVVASLYGTDDEKVKLAAKLSPEFTGRTALITTAITGRAETTRQISAQAEDDLQHSEFLTAPLVFAALVIIFGSLVAALLPLSVGVVAVLGTFVILTLMAQLTEVSVFALNLTTGLGLGLAIDYSLFVVSRYREELARGVSSAVAIGRTMQTAGRTVAFSAGTVAIALLTLAIFPMAYLRSFAYAGIAVVVLAAIAAIVVLPAVLTILGPRVENGRVFKVRDHADGGFWGRQSYRVMRRPVPYIVGVTAVLLLLAVPFFGVVAGLPDDRVVPPSVSSRAATDQIRAHFASREADALQVDVPRADVAADASVIDEFARRLAALPGVSRVDAITGYYLVNDGKVVAVPPDGLSQRFAPRPGGTGTLLSVVPDLEPLSPEGEGLVHAVRATKAPFAFMVAGPSAQLVDAKDAVLELLPVAIGLIATATFILLFMMTGSLLVPVKALVLNVLSLTATFGAMVWIFQEGHFADVLGFTPTGTVDVFTPILMFCIAFGLSMDYEVFVLSRIKEEYDLDRDNEHAVASGLQKTGRIVTAAALLLMIVFAGLATSEVALVKQFAVGLALAVLVDAFLIRATLMPAFMRLAGRLNWWAPRWLRRWHLRFGIHEHEPVALLDREFDAMIDRGSDQALSGRSNTNAT
jgi:RND superfamily putative drug exporter